jgi:hypothetical protein
MPDEPFAIVQQYDDLVAAIRRRVVELDVPYESVDDTAGLPARYLGKLLSSPPMHFGRESLIPTLSALGLKLVVVVVKDGAAIGRPAQPSLPKNAGLTTIIPTLSALGLGLLLVEDEVAMERFTSRLPKRQIARPTVPHWRHRLAVVP